MMSGLKMKYYLIKKNLQILSDMLPLEGDKEVKEGKGLKFLTLKKLLFRLQYYQC